MIAFLLVLLVVFLVYKFRELNTKNSDYFEVRGVKSIVRKPFYAGLLRVIRKQISIIDIVQEIYDQQPNEKIIGLWDMTKPVIMIKDPDLVKVIAVKEFDHFQDRRTVITEQMDELFGNSLLVLKGQKWRDMRSTLSPAFTGSKMRLMSDLVVEICEQMVEFLNEEARVKGPQTHEMKDLFSRLANDVIATSAFGVKVDSLKDRKNDFYESAKEMSDFTTPRKGVKIMLYRTLPWLMQALKVKINQPRETAFLRTLVTESMKIREQKNIVRPDMINLLMEAKKGRLTHAEKSDKDSAGFATVEESNVGLKTVRREWSDNEILAQCFLFLLAGFETTSSVLSFTAYEIAVNPDVQEKLFEEIKEISEELQGKKLSYDILQRMKYMDMVVSESMRKWPAAAFVDRICNKEFKLEYDKGRFFDVPIELSCWIPIVSFHKDPKFFPNPEKFDPERFSDENKSSINPNAYLPFGIGPRNCIGSRFALMEVKAILFYLVLNFSLDVTEETQIPIRLAKSISSLQSEKGIHLKLRPRV
ncbi:probable cytochrome P450 9f2 [Phlebotomus argentipes]|uniref:probable cytochrome P450 9f2 n=1 Tax=Phlebotomus argentipes TaxID=94469 RepID=UPI0028937D75|nr:probable cytochrome P450 9f2 [Phlebotomus argentipes]